MATRTFTTTLAVVLSAAPLTLALPQNTDATANKPKSVFTPWSSDPACAAPATACKADCTRAVDNLCRKDLTTDNIIETVGECTALYMYEIGNTNPTYDQCYSTFAVINDAGKPGPDGCGGTFGGALGYDEKGDRTRDPMYAIYPKSGNGNCFKRLGDTSPPLPLDMLPDGTRLPIDQCPAATSGRKLTAGAGDFVGCFVEDAAWQIGCNAVCLEWVAALSFWTAGVGLAIGFLPCLGACDGVGYKLTSTCVKSHGGDKIKARQDAPPDPCKNIMKVGFECPAIQQHLLAYHKCPGTEKPVDIPEADGTIHT
ncbi:MAG: hypothetical protein Q9171_005252 [Xanthocarpia ochracea]